jgi:asparagine N-glycosylation enzyme membrane subunit Stt3
MGTDPGAGGRRSLRILLTGGLFVLAFALRALPWPSVLLGDRVLPFGQDAFYHLRRITYSVRHFPEVLAFDRYLNFPAGAKPIWTPLFDWTVALLLRSFAVDDPAAVERLAVWVPPVLGAATVLGLVGLARRHFDPATALLAGFVLSLLSGHFWYSQIGFVDHHAAVALAATGVLAGGMSLVADPVGAGGGGRAVVGAGVAFGLAMLLWPGCLLHVGLVQVGGIAAVLTRSCRGPARRLARRVAGAHAIAFGVVLAPALMRGGTPWEGYSPLVESGFQPWLFAAGALWAMACAALWARPGLGATRRARVAVGLVAGGLLIAASAAVLPGFLEGLGDAGSWLAKTEPFQARVAESRGLLVQGGGAGDDVAAARLSYFVFVFPLAWALAVRATREERHPTAFALFLGWAGGLFLATLLQRRFFNSFAVALALLLAWTVLRAWRSLPAAWIASPGRRLALGAGCAAAVVALLQPGLGSYGVALSNQLRWLRGDAIELTPSVARTLVSVETAEWLREHTPATGGWLDERIPAYGVLAPWPLGHVIEYVARRPTVTDNFGDDIGEANFQLAHRYFLAGEAEASELLRSVRARYVIAQARSNFLGETAGPGSMLHSLYRLDGAEGPPAADAAPAGVPALVRHRLVYESRGLRPEGAALYKVYEFVPGARIVGAAPPGEAIHLALALRTNRGRRLVYRASGAADARGRYVLRVPYANRGGPPAVAVGSDYTLACRGETQRVRVREAEVRSDAEVPGPALCAVPGRTGARPGPRSVGPQAGLL